MKFYWLLITDEEWVKKLTKPWFQRRVIQQSIEFDVVLGFLTKKPWTKLG